MRVLLTCGWLDSRSGSVISTRDLAVGLLARGHEPVVYSPHLGAVADEIRAAGVKAVADLNEISAAPDVIHGCHHVETVQALQRFPSTPGLFVCRDATAWHDEPPLHPRLLRFVGIDLLCEQRLRQQPGIAPETVRMIRHGFDLSALPMRAPLPARPRRALIYSNGAGWGAWSRQIRLACKSMGVKVDAVGMSLGNQTARPQDLLPAYDIVFAKGRSAFEAAAIGAAVIACDQVGLGPALNAANVGECWTWNCGQHVLRDPVTRAGVAARLRQYDPREAAAVRDFVRAHGRLDLALDAWIALYNEVLSASPKQDLPGEAAATIHALDLLRAVYNDSERQRGEAETALWWYRQRNVAGLSRLIADWVRGISPGVPSGRRSLRRSPKPGAR